MLPLFRLYHSRSQNLVSIHVQHVCHSLQSSQCPFVSIKVRQNHPMTNQDHRIAGMVQYLVDLNLYGIAQMLSAMNKVEVRLRGPNRP